MRQIVTSRTGSAEVMKIMESPDPKPKHGEVLIRVNAAGLNFADIMARQGLYPDAPKLPAVMGYEVSGVVEAIGEDVDSSFIGKEVLAMTRFGGQSEMICAPIVQVFEKPGPMPFEEAAAIPVTYLTAYALLMVMGSLKAGETVLIHNAGGGVGLAAIDIAKHAGAHIIGTASAGKHEFLKDRGLDYVIDYRTKDWLTELLDYTHGKGVELIIDPIGGSNFKKSYKALRSTGRLGMFGISITSGNAGLAGQWNMLKMAVSLPFYHPVPLMNNNKGVFGINLGHLWHEGDKVGAWADEILKGYDEGWIHPRVDKVFSFEEIGDAHRYIEERRNIGKVILVP